MKEVHRRFVEAVESRLKEEELMVCMLCHSNNFLPDKSHSLKADYQRVFDLMGKYKCK